jgi:hypothetical protein
MRLKRGWALGIGIVCTVVLLTAWNRRARKADVTLSFVGFTNQFVPIQTPSGKGTMVTKMGVLLAENKGPLPVEITSMWRNPQKPLLSNVWESKAFYAATNGQFPRMLKPGEGFEFLIFQSLEGKDFSFTELNYFPQTIWRRFYQRAMSKAGLRVQWFLAWSLGTPEGEWANSGLIPKPPDPFTELTHSPGFRSAVANSLFDESRDLERRVKERLLELDSDKGPAH